MLIRLKFFLFLLFTCIVGWIIFSAWVPNLESYTVVGHVEALHGEVAKVKIKYTEDPNDYDYERMKEIDVGADGRFKSVINVKANGTICFYAYKKGYTTSRKVVALEYPDAENDIGSINISSLHEELGYNQIKDTRKMPQLRLFRDECLLKLNGQVSVNEIMYFDQIQALPASGLSCSHSSNTALLKARLNLNGKLGPEAYFSLTKLASGEAFITEPYHPSNVISTADEGMLAKENKAASSKKK